MSRISLPPVDPLTSWTTLNSSLMGGNEAWCQELIEREKTGSRRLMFLLRIHSRLNKLRADRERAELHRVAKR